TFHAKRFQLCQPIGGVVATGVSAVTGAVMNMVARASERTSERMRHAPLVGGAANELRTVSAATALASTRSRLAVARKWPRLNRLREVNASRGPASASNMLQPHMEKR